MHRTLLGPLALFFLFAGSVETGKWTVGWLESRDLDQKGLEAKAQVIDKFIGGRSSGRRQGPDTFWLIVRFVPDGAESLETNIRVPKPRFDAQAVPESNVVVRYLPNHPNVAFVEGARLPLQSIFIGPGALLAGLAAGAGWLWRRSKGLPPA